MRIRWALAVVVALASVGCGSAPSTPATAVICPISVVAPLPGTDPRTGELAPVGTDVIVHPGDVVAAKSFVDPDPSSAPAMWVALDPVGAVALETYSAAHVGEPIVIVVDRMVVGAPVLLTTMDRFRIEPSSLTPGAWDAIRPCALGKPPG